MDRDLDEAFQDVRRAYRLIAAYQRRALDIVDELVRQFEKFQFYYWSPVQFAPPPRRSSDPVGRWAWDGLPYYCFSCLYLPVGAKLDEPKKGEWRLKINIDADTGYSAGDDEPDPTKFRDVTECESLLRLYGWRCEADDNVGDWYYGLWDVDDWPKTEGVLQPVEKGNYSVGFQAHRLSEITSENDLPGIARSFSKMMES